MHAVLVGMLCLALQGAASPEDVLRQASNAYAYGDYAGAVLRLRRLMRTPQLTDPALAGEAHLLLLLAAYLQGDTATAREAAAWLLERDPAYELDPFSVAPAIMDLFEAVRGELPQHRAPPPPSSAAAAAAGPTARTTTQVVRIVDYRRVERPAFLVYLPFGVGQFVNGDRGWGLFFALAEGGLLATNIAAYGLALATPVGPADPAARLQVLRGLQFGSLAALAVLWPAGILQAHAKFTPVIDLPPAVRGPSPALGASIRGSF